MREFKSHTLQMIFFLLVVSSEMTVHTYVRQRYSSKYKSFKTVSHSCQQEPKNKARLTECFKRQMEALLWSEPWVRIPYLTLKETHLFNTRS